MKKTVLFVSIAFPPKFDSEGLQVAKYFKYLTKQDKFDFTVVTSAIPTLFMPYDASLEKAKEGAKEIVEIKIWENKYSNFLLRKIAQQLVDRPDSKWTFYAQWRKVISKVKTQPAIIYSRSFPASSAMMAMKLKAYYKVPWVMHLSDPWADSPVNVLTGSTKKLNLEMERLCFENADKICLTSYETIDFYTKKYPHLKEKFEYFPNVYDPADIKPIATPKKNDKLRFVYTGGMAGNRSPEPFLKAITKLPKHIQDKLAFVFSGYADRQNAALFDQYKCDCIQYLGHLDTYQEAITLQNSADVLLLIDFPIKEKEKRMYFLSKILDYMIAQKYILATTGAGSTCNSVIEGKLGACFEEENIGGIQQHILFLLAKFETEYDTFFNKNNIDSTFDAQVNANRLLALFEKMT
ncbi:MAG: hypothetical protein IPN09_17520 [Bacteroidetes bacterium]|nr:hypothetical protein [Bacteroidota bacterium]